MLKGFTSQEVKNSLWFKGVLNHPVFASFCHNRKEKKCLVDGCSFRSQESAMHTGCP